MATVSDNERQSLITALALTPTTARSLTNTDLEREYYRVGLADTIAVAATKSTAQYRMQWWSALTSAISYQDRQKEYFRIKNGLTVNAAAILDVDYLKALWYATLPVAP